MAKATLAKGEIIDALVYRSGAKMPKLIRCRSLYGSRIYRAQSKAAVRSPAFGRAPASGSKPNLRVINLMIASYRLFQLFITLTFNKS